MKSIAPYIFLIALLYQSVGQLGVLAYFQINQKFISVNQCENRDKPKLKCNGKCYLSKQLKKLDGKQETKQDNKENKTENNVYLVVETITFKQIIILIDKIKFYYLNAIPSAPLPSIYHPPPFLTA